MIIVFGTSVPDVQAFCNSNGLQFEDVMWVREASLLAKTDTTGAEYYFTNLFRRGPHYAAAQRLVNP